MPNLFLIGGDRRQQYLKESLQSEGMTTYSIGLSKNENRAAFFKKLQSEYAPTILLPLPTTKDGTNIFMPLQEEGLSFIELLKYCPVSTCIFGFSIPKDWCRVAKEQDIWLKDLYSENVKKKNAELTAKATEQVLNLHFKGNLSEKKIAILGYGRIAQSLFALPSLKKTKLYFFVRNIKKYQNQKVLYDLKNLSSYLPDMDAFINTVPARILSPDAIQKTKEEVLLLELASKPYGMDIDFAQKKGRKAMLLSGLPGKYYPLESSLILLHAFLEYL